MVAYTESHSGGVEVIARGTKAECKEAIRRLPRRDREEIAYAGNARVVSNALADGIMTGDGAHPLRLPR